MLVERASEQTTGFEPATLHLGNGMGDVSCVSTGLTSALSCAFLALLSHPSHRIAGVDSISLVLSRHGRLIPRRKSTTQSNGAVDKAYPQKETPILPPFSGHLTPR